MLEYSKRQPALLALVPRLGICELAVRAHHIRLAPVALGGGRRGHSILALCWSPWPPLLYVELGGVEGCILDFEAMALDVLDELECELTVNLNSVVRRYTQQHQEVNHKLMG